MADQESTQFPITPEEVVKTIYLAKQVGSEKTFNYFRQQLREGKIPWSTSDKRFVQKVQWLKETLIAELNAQNEEGLRQVVEASFSHALSADEREGLLKGVGRVHQEIQTHEKYLHERAGFLVNKFVTQLKNQGAIQPDQESAVHDAAFNVAQETLSRGRPSDLSKELTRVAANFNIANENAVSAASDLEIPQEVQQSNEAIAKLSKITEMALTSGDEVQKGALVDYCLSDPNVDPEVVVDKYGGKLRAEKIFAVAEVPLVENEINAALDARDESGRSLRGVALQKSLEGAQPEVVKLFSEFVDPVKLKAAVGEAVDAVTGKYVQEAKTGSVGGKQIQMTPEKTKRLQLFERGLTQRNTVRQASKIFFNNALLASASAVWEPKIQRAFFVYLESATVQASVRAPEYFHYVVLAGTDVWNSIIGRSTKVAVSAAAKTAGSALLKKGAEKGVGAAVGATAGVTIGGVPGAIVGWIGSNVVGKVFSFVWGGIKGLFSFFRFGGIAEGITQRRAGAGPKKGFFNKLAVGDEGALSWALAVLLAFSVFFFGSGFTFLRETATTAAIVAEKEKSAPSEETQTPGRGFPHENPEADAEYNATVAREKGRQRPKQTPVDYTATPENAARVEALKNSANVTLLVTSSDPKYAPKITQLPGDLRTHARVNAVDVGAPLQSIVRSPVAGIVLDSSVNKYADGSGFAGSTDGGGYGNFVDIQTPQGYILRVAHLAYNSQPPVGTNVSIGDVIGRSGQTGNSTGPHFHFEFRGAGAPDILTIFNP